MKYKLKDICKISSGQTFREKIENKPNGDVWVIQMKDLGNEYNNINSEPSKVFRNEISTNQLLQKGDVLFLARGNNNKSFVFDWDEPTVAVSVFFILRVQYDKIDPQFLSWFLNHPTTQNSFLGAQEGATVASIKKQFIDELEIELPEIAEQKKIARIHELHLKEINLLDQLKQHRTELINSILYQKSHKH